MQAVHVKYKDCQKYICYEGQLTFKSFLDCVANKFDVLTLDLKVYDESKTEVELFEFLLKKQDLGVLENCLPQDPNPGVCVSRTSPSRRVKEDYTKGIIALFPYLADPRSKFGYEHYYNAEDGSGYLAW